MIDIMQLVEETKKHIQSDVFPFYFPESSKDDCVVVNLKEPLGRNRTVSEVVATFMVRGKHPQQALDVCSVLKDLYDKKTDLYFQDVQVILMIANQEHGQFQGVDDQGRYVFLIDFKVLSSRTDRLN